MKDANDYLNTYGKVKPIVSRKFVPLMSELYIESYSNPKNHELFYFIEFFNRCGYLDEKYYYGDEYKELGEILISKENKSRGHIFKILNKIYEFGERLLSFSEELKTINYSNLNNQELTKLFDRFAKEYIIYSISLASHCLDYSVEKRLRELVKDRDNSNEELNILSSPKKDNFAILEQISLFKIGTLIREQDIGCFEDLPPEILQKIQEHINEFGWINTKGGQANPWNQKEIFERVQNIKDDFSQKIAKLKEDKIGLQEKSKEIIRELNADDKTINLIEISKELVYFRTYRSDYVTKIFFNVKPLLEKIAKNKNLTYEEILYLRIKEITEEVEVSKEEIERRKTDYVLITLEPNKIIFSSDPKMIKEIKGEYCEEPKISQEISGRSAFIGQGKVQGRVKIVTNKADLIKVNTGDILISPMTTPDFVIAMEKAAAFVTDEGGITCHAAIVAREMKKPCIIGTQNATKSLKDNDFVEVDSEKGVVKIIKKN